MRAAKNDLETVEKRTKLWVAPATNCGLPPPDVLGFEESSAKMMNKVKYERETT